MCHVLGMIVTALFARGPWLFIRVDSTGKSGYIPRLICSLDTHEHLLASTAAKSEPYYKSTRSVCSAMTSVQSEQSKRRRLVYVPFDERDRRNTYTLPRPNGLFSKDRRSTMNALSISNPDHLGSDPPALSIPTRDTDSSSTQDSGYSEPTSFYLDQECSAKKVVRRDRPRLVSLSTFLRRN